MDMKLLKIIAFFAIITIIFSCENHNKSSQENYTNTLIKYAKGFDIQNYKNYKKLIIKSPYPKAKEQFEYVLIPKDSNIPNEVKNATIIRIPITKIVVTSTTHIPMLELLHEENTLVGFPNTQYISSERTRKRILENKIIELGKGENINTEVLLNLNPEVVVSFSMSKNNKMFSSIEKAGIPVLLNGDWLEETPLGRAEWVKFFAALYNKEKEADSIFKQIEIEYNSAKLLAEKALKKPTILSGVLFKDIWNLPAGDSFVAQFLKDANTDYLWAGTKGKGSLSLSFESVFEKAQHADFWIAPGHYKTLSELINANKHYAKFNAFKEQKIYTFATTTGANGGVLYYELAPVQPHIVLKDIIKVTHPELLPNYTPFFLQKLN